MKAIEVETQRGTILRGALFSAGGDTVFIAITGIHGNFYSNPFYYDVAESLNSHGIDFICAFTNDATSEIQTRNAKTGVDEVIGSWNERFEDTDDDVRSYIDFAERAGYQHIILGGHSLGANKVIHYLSGNHDSRVEHFFFLSPAELKHMTSDVSDREKDLICKFVERGDGEKILPFYFMGWLICTARTGYQWLFSEILDNVHLERNGNFDQASRITHTGAMLIGTYDTFTRGDPRAFLTNLNNHLPTSQNNKLIFIEKTGHTYQHKEKELAQKILETILEWRNES